MTFGAVTVTMSAEAMGILAFLGILMLSFGGLGCAILAEEWMNRPRRRFEYHMRGLYGNAPTERANTKVTQLPPAAMQYGEAEGNYVEREGQNERTETRATVVRRQYGSRRA